MKKIYLFSSLLLLSFVSKAQTVTVTDPAFASYLATLVPNCITGNQLNTSCADLQNVTVMYCNSRGLTNIDEIQYFPNLNTLNCASNNLTFLSIFPYSLRTLNASYNVGIIIQNFPPLTSLDITNCYLPRLPFFLNSLQALSCSGNSITTLGQLSDSLTYLDCSANQLTTLTDGYPLPARLVSLNCDYNPLDSLSTLPTKLQVLSCIRTTIHSLPALPKTIQSLTCTSNFLTTLPTLPDSLKTFYCDYNSLTSLPALPAKMNTFLNASNNQLTTLPALPRPLKVITISHNRLTTLPALPDSLTGILADYNQLTALPTLPATLTSLTIDSNFITAMQLPASLTSLSCPFNLFDTLPPLPVNINTLVIGGNNCTTLPVLHAITNLTIKQSGITDIATLPHYVGFLQISDNKLLNSISVLPDSMRQLTLSGNTSLHCLPPFGYVGDLRLRDSIRCLPNYGRIISATPPLSNFPLCDGVVCQAFWNISGKTYFDANNNCAYDNTDAAQKNIKMLLSKNGVVQLQAYSIDNGNFAILPTDTGVYTVQPDTSVLPFAVQCPVGGTYTDNVVSTNTQFAHNDFALKCKGGYDVGAWSIVADRLRPGRLAVLHINAGDVANFFGEGCASGISGSITATITGPATYISPAPGSITPSSTTATTVTWNVADFGAANLSSQLDIIVEPNTTALLDEQICITVSVTPTNDNNPANNILSQCFKVVTSHDPNLKEASPVGYIDIANGWVTYTVHFQNTGNDTAFDVRVLDTLDTHYDVTTFQLLAYSSKVSASIAGGVAQFVLRNINLPDSTTNEPGSQGYVQYKIKLKPGQPLNTPVSNTASIYFDYNTPVQTNTVSNTITIDVPTGMRPVQNNAELQVSVYPNPSTGLWQLAVGNELVGSNYEVYDEAGRIVFQSQIRNLQSEIRLNVSAGIYYLRISGANSNVVRKLVKM